MRSIVIAPPQKPALSRIDVKRHLRILEENRLEDDYLDSLIEVATEYAQRWLSAPLIKTGYRLLLDHVPRLDGRRIRLPQGPVLGLPTVQYYTTTGQWTPLDGQRFRFFNTDTEHPYLMPVEDWPQTDTDENGARVTVDYFAGLATEPAGLPDDIRHAMELLIGQWFLERSEIVPASMAGRIPHGVTALLARNKRDSGVGHANYE